MESVTFLHFLHDSGTPYSTERLHREAGVALSGLTEDHFTRQARKEVITDTQLLTGQYLEQSNTFSIMKFFIWLHSRIEGFLVWQFRVLCVLFAFQVQIYCLKKSADPFAKIYITVSPLSVDNRFT